MTLRIGHRGAAGTHPENTLCSFHRAVELGCDGAEFDVHRTRDGELVVIHDAVVNRTTNGSGLVRDLTYDDIRGLDAGTWKDPQFCGEKVPTLREVIRSTPPTFQLFIELKAGSIHYPGIEEDMLQVIREEGAHQRTQVSSFDHHALLRLRQLDPDLQLGMLYHENLLDAVALAQAIGANALHPAWEWVTPDLVAKAHAAGLKVNTWTVNLPMVAALVRHCGVDGIMSDFPDHLQW
jgi:glycerophosphoryl diester phosphodiesterase